MYENRGGGGTWSALRLGRGTERLEKAPVELFQRGRAKPMGRLWSATGAPFTTVSFKSFSESSDIKMTHRMVGHFYMVAGEGLALACGLRQGTERPEKAPVELFQRGRAKPMGRLMGPTGAQFTTVPFKSFSEQEI